MASVQNANDEVLFFSFNAIECDWADCGKIKIISWELCLGQVLCTDRDSVETTRDQKGILDPSSPF